MAYTLGSIALDSYAPTDGKYELITPLLYISTSAILKGGTSVIYWGKYKGSDVLVKKLTIPELKDRFKVGAQIGASLDDTRIAARMIEYMEVGGECYLIMYPYIEKSITAENKIKYKFVSLEDALKATVQDETDPDGIKTEPLLGLDERLDYIDQLAEIIEALKVQDVAHFDLKPSNLIILHGKLRLIDFDLAIKQNDPQFKSSLIFNRLDALLGTVCYSSPERAIHRKLDFDPYLSETFSFGLIAFRILFGQSLLTNNLEGFSDLKDFDLGDVNSAPSHNLNKALNASKLSSQTKTALRALFKAILQKEPKRRISIKQFVDDLNRIMLEEQSSAYSVSLNQTAQ